MKPTLITAILASKKKPVGPSEPTEVESKDDDSMALDAASEAVLDAIDSKDVGALKKALMHFVHLCPDMDLDSED
jgi:hypothetical protein